MIIESLSKLICSDQTGKIRLLGKQKLFREIKFRFYDLLAGYRKEFATEEDFIKFKRWISELNRPVNRQFLTNTERLSRPTFLFNGSSGTYGVSFGRLVYYNQRTRIKIYRVYRIHS